jgi:Fur family transcriptional regulator, zinc uptake regulator
MTGHAVVSPFWPARHAHDTCIDDALAAAEQLCAQRGLRLTALRRRVLELVWRRHGPMRAYDILDLLRDERRGAAPPTVYRALDFLLSNGLIHRIESMNAYVGCGAPSAPREGHAGQFLICADCGSVGELDDPDIARLIAAKAEAMGFAVARQTIEATGLCPECAGGDPEDAGP